MKPKPDCTMATVNNICGLFILLHKDEGKESKLLIFQMVPELNVYPILMAQSDALLS